MTFERTCHLSWMNAAMFQWRVPGASMTFRSRETAFGQSSRNDANELAMPDCDAVSDGLPVPDAENPNPPRGPVVSCVCSSLSVFFRHSPPVLIVWLLFIFVSDPTMFHVFSERSHGWLAENPRSGPLWGDGPV